MIRTAVFFHVMASTRRRQNTIIRLKDSRGDWISWGNGLEEVIIDYFTDIFKSSSSDFEVVVQRLDPCVSNDQNSELLKPVSDDEMHSALFQMHPDKSLGPDGMTPRFFQKNWSMVQADVIHLVQQFFQTGVLPVGINHTHIVLIPKKAHPMTMGEFQPISLCNVVYKVISKVLANRLKVFLPSIISANQSAFLPGRLISDNVVVSFEIMHFLKRKTKGKDGFMAIKLDMSKACDRLEWSYLRVVLSRLGFADRWINLIMYCVSFVSYSVLHNNKELGYIVSGRGIRQGDPISPYLFILCFEEFSALFRHHEEVCLLHGCQVARGAPRITHLLFIDDS